MAEQRSEGGSDWVRNEVLASLARAGSLLREGGDLGEAVTLLCEMRATLLGWPLPAAALLVEELQRACEQSLEMAAVDACQVRAVVWSAMGQLEAYLGLGDANEPRDPLALLASINDLRHSRGVPPMSPAELLFTASFLAYGELGASPIPTQSAAGPGAATSGARSDTISTEAAEDEDFEALLAGDDPLPVFVEEAGELVDALALQVRDWRVVGPNAADLALARRRLHDLKGSARMAGVAPVGDLSHALESLLAGAENLPIANSIRMMGLVQRTLDTLSGQIGAIARCKPVVLPDTLLGEIAAASPGAGASGTQGTPERQPKAPSMRETAEPPAAAREDAATTLRVDANWLDGVIRRSGEVGKQHVRLLQQNARLGRRVSQLQAILKRVTQRVDSLGERGETALPEAGDETRENARVLSDARVLLRESSGVTAAIAELQRDSASLLTQQARIARCLQEDLLNARVLPFGHVQARLTRLVRLTADAVGKRVRLTLSGADTVLDRSVLERFVAPLEHLLRNAVVHGIEPPSTRAALGKPQVGEVSIALTREDNDAVFDIADNGAGIDTVKVRERAVALGLVAADAQLPESEVLALTLRPGLSTADAVTQEAGRGVGLDVVSTQVASLNGELTLYSSPGRGMRARVRLPLTLSIA